MRKISVVNYMSLDGVIQSPASADEDRSGGFEHGGWSVQYMDEPSMASVLGAINEAGGYLLGRRTYEIFAAHWPTAPEEQQALAEPMNRLPMAGALNGLLYGALLFALNDEWANTALGLSGPPDAYPIDSHLRGLVGHLALGVTTDATLAVLPG